MAISAVVKKIAAQAAGENPKNGLLALADQGVVSLTSFLSTVAIGRFCSRTELGSYSLGMSIIFLLLCLQESVITLPYTVYSPRLQQQEQQAYNGSMILHQLLVAMLTVAIGLAAAAAAAALPGADGRLAEILFAVAVAMTPVLLREYMRRIYLAQLRLSLVLQLDLTASLLQICGLLAVSGLGLLCAASAYYVMAVAGAVAAFAFMRSYLSQCSFSFRQSRQDFRRNWAFGRWVLAANVTSLASSQLYLWFLAFFHDAAAAGIFAACQGVVFLSNPFLSGMRNLLGPQASMALATDGKDHLKRVLRNSAFLLGSVMAAFTVVLWLWGELLLEWLYGRQYAGYGSIVSILAASFFVYSLALPFAYGLIAMERCDLNFRIDLLALLVTATLGVLLVQRYSSLGVAWALLVSNVLALLVRRHIFTRCVRSQA